MRQLEIFLKLLAAEVSEQPRKGVPMGDATDFAAWLQNCSRLAGACRTEQEFFATLRN